MVDGRDAQRWIGRSERAEFSLWVIVEMMRLCGPMGLTRGIEYGKIGAWQRQVDSEALI